ncbi:MAG: biopolymer transporter ExbD [Endomicrobium sp.]|jgi:biopolymer transport protein ExbD|nr:biopolymer transporter ExbD [Endomicrobium sp.]
MKTRINKNMVKSEINITPFTDVVLVLLIIFMIATPALMQSKLEMQVNLPKVESADSGSSTNIEALISQDGKITIGAKVINLSDVEGVVRELLEEDHGKLIVVKGDVKVDYDHVVQFISKAKKAGVVKFALAVEAK